MALGAFNSISDLFVNLGENITILGSDSNFMYGLYFVVLLLALNVVYGTILGKVSALDGKPAKVLGFAFAIFSVGALFFGPGQKARGVTETVVMFNGFGWFLASMGICALLIFFTKSMYQNVESTKLKMFYLSSGSLMTTMILLPYFQEGGYIASHISSLVMIGGIIEAILAISLLIFFPSLGFVIIGLVMGNKKGDGGIMDKFEEYHHLRFEQDQLGKFENLLMSAFNKGDDAITRLKEWAK